MFCNDFYNIFRFNLPKDIDYDEIVHNFPENISGADVYGLCSEAWMSAARRVIKKLEDGNFTVFSKRN